LLSVVVFLLEALPVYSVNAEIAAIKPNNFLSLSNFNGEFDLIKLIQYHTTVKILPYNSQNKTSISTICEPNSWESELKTGLVCALPLACDPHLYIKGDCFDVVHVILTWTFSKKYYLVLDKFTRNIKTRFNHLLKVLEG